MTEPNVTLALESQPENVSLVREVLSGVADFVGLEIEELDDIKTAVSEACNNVVLHAYEGEVGALQVDIAIGAGTLQVIVRDFGTGIRPRPASEERMQGIGLSVIQALTDRVEFRGAAEHGTEVLMAFSNEGIRELEGADEASIDETALRAVADGTLAMLRIQPTPLAPTILTRIVAALAARARFSIDRLSDAQLVADSVAAHAPPALIDGHLRVGLTMGERLLEMRVGPLSAGQGEQLVAASAVGGLGPLLAKLSDEVDVAHASGVDVLTLRLRDDR